MTDFIGQQLGNYRLIRLLGRGGFAEVYLGEHIHLDNYTAIKVLKTHVASEDIERFRNEARLIVNLKNQYIVPVLDFGIQNGTPFLVMEHAVNGTLRQRHPRGSIVPLDTIVSYVKQVAAALQYAHNHNVIHRDVKPENMLQAPDNGIWLSDFGIALIAQSTQASMQDVAGSFLYMAPEQIQGYPCAASDQYSLGIVVYEWLCGSPPFQGSLNELPMQHMHAPPPSLLHKVSTLSPAIESVVFKVLAKDPKQRYARVQDFATDLEQACQETVVREAAIVGPAGRFALGSAVVRIGRTPDNQLVLDDHQISQHHAEVHPQGPGYAITDVGSTNGTFVNGQPLIARVPRLLNAGDAIRIGITQLTYEARESPFEKTRRMPPPPPKKPWWQRTEGIVALILAVIVILGGISAILTVISSFHKPASLTGSPTAPPTSPPTIDPARATAIAAQNLYNSATNGTLALNDSLSDNSQGNQWDEISSSCQFTGRAYHVYVTQQSSIVHCTAHMTNYT